MPAAPECRQNGFLKEDDYGRAQVMGQWGDDADAISEAIDLCPVDSIHYVRRDQLALLEFVLKGCKREGPAISARRYISAYKLPALQANGHCCCRLALSWPAEWASLSCDGGRKVPALPW